MASSAGSRHGLHCVTSSRHSAERARAEGSRDRITAARAACAPHDRGDVAIAGVARAALGVYASLICFATIRAKGGWRMAPVLAAMHLAWSVGVGVALAGAAQQRLRRPPRPTDS